MMQRQLCFLSLFIFSFLTSINAYADNHKGHKINCLRVSNRLEKLVCSDPDLENQDKQLNGAYLDALDDADDEEQQVIIREENAFLPLLHQCVTSHMSSPTPLPTPEEKGCLINLYQLRFSELKSWPEDESQEISATNNRYKVIIRLYFNRSNYHYTAETELINRRGKVINEGTFAGCTKNQGIVMNLAKHLQESHALLLTSIPQGFAIHNIEKCGEKPTWQLQVITPECFVLAPASAAGGQRISIGGDPSRLYFAYIVNHETIPSYLDIDEEGKISYTLPPELKDKDVSPEPVIECQ